VSENVLVAFIAAFPSTLAALAALWQVRKLSQPIAETNAAVNHRVPGQKRLVELVDDIHSEVHDLADRVEEVRNDLAQHRAYHTLTDAEENPE
jgi:uncharacterized protein YlxW (UPF0749 family)